jgi:hypothetical protein
MAVDKILNDRKKKAFFFSFNNCHRIGGGGNGTVYQEERNESKGEARGRKGRAKDKKVNGRKLKRRRSEESKGK